MNENQNVDDVSIEEVKNLLFSKETIPEKSGKIFL